MTNSPGLRFSHVARIYNECLSLSETARRTKLTIEDVQSYLEKRQGYPGRITMRGEEGGGPARRLYRPDPVTGLRPVTLPRLSFLEDAGKEHP